MSSTARVSLPLGKMRRSQSSHRCAMRPTASPWRRAKRRHARLLPLRPWQGSRGSLARRLTTIVRRRLSFRTSPSCPLVCLTWPAALEMPQSPRWSLRRASYRCAHRKRRRSSGVMWRRNAAMPYRTSLRRCKMRRVNWRSIVRLSSRRLES